MRDHTVLFYIIIGIPFFGVIAYSVVKALSSDKNVE